jgi:hypothetical protein
MRRLVRRAGLVRLCDGALPAAHQWVKRWKNRLRWIVGDTSLNR